MHTPHTDPASPTQALGLLRSWGAPPRLLRHAELVAEAATDISDALTRIGVRHDARVVIVGAALHDAGKIIHPEELVGPGRQHEAAGERLLLDLGLSPPLARVCRTHAAWADEGTTLEERAVACADHIWKGSRDAALEHLLTADVAGRLGVAPWEAMLLLDAALDRIASGADDRLARARG